MQKQAKSAQTQHWKQDTSPVSGTREEVEEGTPLGEQRRRSAVEIKNAMDTLVGDKLYVVYVTQKNGKLVFRSIGPIKDSSVQDILQGIAECLIANRESDPAIAQAMEDADGIALMDCSEDSV